MACYVLGAISWRGVAWRSGVLCARSYLLARRSVARRNVLGAISWRGVAWRGVARHGVALGAISWRRDRWSLPGTGSWKKGS